MADLTIKDISGLQEVSVTTFEVNAVQASRFYQVRSGTGRFYKVRQGEVRLVSLSHF